MERDLLILGRITSLYVASKPILNPPNNQPFGDPFTSSQDTHVLNNKAWCCRCVIFVDQHIHPVATRGPPHETHPRSPRGRSTNFPIWAPENLAIGGWHLSVDPSCGHVKIWLSEDLSRIHAPVIDKIEIHHDPSNSSYIMLYHVISCYIIRIRNDPTKSIQ